MNRSYSSILVVMIVCTAKAGPVESPLRLLGKVQGVAFEDTKEPMTAGLAVTGRVPKGIMVMVEKLNSSKEEAPIQKIGVLQRTEIPAVLAAIRKAEKAAASQTKRDALATYSYRNKSQFALDASAFGTHVVGVLTVGYDHRKMIVADGEFIRFKTVLINFLK